jgi:hypothetical protein
MDLAVGTVPCLYLDGRRKSGMHLTYGVIIFMSVRRRCIDMLTIFRLKWIHFGSHAPAASGESAMHRSSLLMMVGGIQHIEPCPDVI